MQHHGAAAAPPAVPAVHPTPQPTAPSSSSTSTTSTTSDGDSDGAAASSGPPQASSHGETKTSPAAESSKQQRFVNEHPGSIANGTALRIMALGASITKGEQSAGTVGFRQLLRDELAAAGAPVNMVGSVRLGDFADNEVEAYGGILITKVHEYARKAVPKLQPNVFVINAGTNNALQTTAVATAGRDMGALVDYLLEASPRSFVVMSTLVTNTVPNCEPLILDMNQQFWDLMDAYEAAGKPVVMAEMHAGSGLPGRPTASDVGGDGTHPTDEGYRMMGRIFVEAVKEADRKGFVQVPVDNGVPADGNAAAASDADDDDAAAPAPEPAPARRFRKRTPSPGVRFLSAAEGRRRFMLAKRTWCVSG